MPDFPNALEVAQGSMSPAEFASALGVSARTLHNWRTGASVPISPVVWRALEAHGISRDIVQAARAAS